MKNNSFNYNSFNYNSFNHKSIQYIFLAIIICIIFFYTVCYIYNKFYNYKFIFHIHHT